MENIRSLLKDGLSNDIYTKYALALPAEYLLNQSVATLSEDCSLMASLNATNQYAISIHDGSARGSNLWQIKLLRLNQVVSLSRGLPILENFGFKLLDEKSCKIQISDSEQIFVCDFGIEVPENLINKINDTVVIDNLKTAILAAFNRQTDRDNLNSLVLYSGLSAREVALVRGVVRYLVQTNLNFSAAYISECLIKYANLSKLLFDLFAAKFCPLTHATQKVAQIQTEVTQELAKVENLAEDQILKAAFAVVNAMLRTNFYQTIAAGEYKAYISFKLDSMQVLNLPKPIPLYEIFVYSPRFEAVHLRGGKVARGGLRWSDRYEDFRTEILGLVKAQIVKNSVIVPTGSKGGFVCKKLPSYNDREAYLAEGISCYQQFISGLLDVTDNLVNGKIVHPKQVVRHDDDDPYLVVAADKGTATFSDYANQISQQYAFWLGDAFASGGSAGYDHKAMGITARGAWESVRRYFRHLGVDTQTQEFTVIGIGDMMGDVFGNGMLLSDKIRLLAAFDGKHIFIDPTPNAASSFIERQRLFNLSRSSWCDYDLNKISKGGGIHSRSEKSIKLTPEVKSWLKITQDSLTPDELIHQILLAKADLLYNGGIGTYIKAETQSQEEVRDKASDNLRVNGKQLQVKVVGEGGNLTATQLGRIEFAKVGGLICTDAIDNSAGVDCSDHEVNIKILFAAVMQQTGMSVEKRNEILANMTTDVASLVLRDNYLQTLLLKTAECRGLYTLANHQLLMRKLEQTGELDRKVEFLPSDQEINLRLQEGKGLTSPELAVLLAYSKISLDRELLQSSLVSDSDFNGLLLAYFPALLQEKYADFILNHYLRKEIIANVLANLVVNRAGITFISRFSNEFSRPVSEIVKAWWIAYNLLDAASLYAQIEKLDGGINADLQLKLFIGVEKSVERLCRWILRYVIDFNSASDIIAKFKTHVTELTTHIARLIPGDEYPEVREQEERYVTCGVPSYLAKLLSREGYLPQVMDIVCLATEFKFDYELIAKNYFAAGRILQLDWLRKNVLLLPRDNKWQALARSAILTDIYKLYRRLMFLAMQTTQADIDQWINHNSDKVSQIQVLVNELQSYSSLDLAMLSAATHELVNIVN